MVRHIQMSTGNLACCDADFRPRLRCYPLRRAELYGKTHVIELREPNCMVKHIKMSTGKTDGSGRISDRGLDAALLGEPNCMVKHIKMSTGLDAALLGEPNCMVKHM